MSSFSKKENKNQGAQEAQEKFTHTTNEEKARVNHLTRKSPRIKCDGTKILGNEGEIELPKTFHISMLVQIEDDKGIKRETNE